VHISRVRITNFANFQALDIETGENMVIVGENKVGKSNFLRAIQLILDPSLSERDRRLGLEHFWDGLGDDKLGETVEVSIELTEATDDPRLLRYLADCVVEVGPPFVGRLTYRYQPKTGLGRAPTSLADYEYVIFGGIDPDNGYGSDLRRMIPMDVQGALRDAEKDLASWRHSPLRPLIESLTATLDDDAREEIQDQIDAAHTALNDRPEIEATADRINVRLTQMVGEQHAVPLLLGLSPTRLDALLRGLRLLIDGGARSISDASLGSANLIFLALKSLELDRLVAEGERDHTFFAVEEPEAHLHPHVQRLVYRHFLAPQATDDLERAPRRQTTILTTHSPHIASVAPLRSIVLLRKSADEDATIGFSAAKAPLTPREIADLQRYIDVTRGELFFARGVVLVEGDAERFLIPAFADALGVSLDGVGISVCSVGGTNFAPFVKLFGPAGLDIPYVVLTDRDAVAGKPPLALNRLRALLAIIHPTYDWPATEEEVVFKWGVSSGLFVNGNTLEPVLFEFGLGAAMQRILLEELSISAATKAKLQTWVDDPDILDNDLLLRLINRVGKGRFAQALALHVTVATCPGYIRSALERIGDDVA
jgi:putative ATP-dependent endonuclease of OLD family